MFLAILEKLFFLAMTFWIARLFAVPLTILFRPLGAIATFILWPAVVIYYFLYQLFH